MSTYKTVIDAGYKQSSTDPFKFKNGDSSVTLRPGQGIIVTNGGRTNGYGGNTSDSFLSDRIKK